MFARKMHSLLPSLKERTFVALDFETADHGADSACSIGVVRVDNLRITAREVVLIRPPRPRILFTHIHRITWPMVKDAEPFAGVWAKLEPVFEGASLLVAHNSSFDSRVLRACCLRAGVSAPETPFLCTVHLSRFIWNQRPNDLKSVCQRLSIPLDHHDAGSDAEACARIVIAAAAAHGVAPSPLNLFNHSFQ
jgi:DNA polymerase-3 subunit epsilon